MVTTNESPPQRQRSETKRSNKPIMEKRRRARINNCLNELKSLILDAMKKDSARHSKLEKADILEMTVKHVETLQRHQMALTAAADPSIVNKFKAGWGECVSEVGRFPGLDQSVRHRLMEHLSTCMESRDASSPTSWEHQPVVVQKLSQQSQATTVVVTTVSRQQCSPSPRSLSPPQQQQQQQPPSPSQHPQPVTLAASPSPTMIQQSPLPRQGSIVALVPTRLPNGDIALVLPSPPPLATSNQPLSLVVNKSTDVEKPWRPW